jgi:hypothetical protein
MSVGPLEILCTLANDERNHLLRYRLARTDVGRLKEAEKNLLVSRLMTHYPTQGDYPHKRCAGL